MTSKAIPYTVTLLQALQPAVDSRLERAAIKEALRLLKKEFPEAFETPEG